MRTTARSTLLGSLVGTALFAGAPASAQAPTATPRAAVVFSGPTMGTRYTVRVVMAPGDEAANELIRVAVDRELSLVNRRFSAFDPGSEISRLNASASTEPIAVSAELIEALELGRRASELTHGAFDVTVTPLVEAWGFGPSKSPPAVPSAEAIALLRARVGYRQLSLDTARKTVAKARPDVACDVSALGDGWAADRVARALVALGHPDVLVDVGGEVSARGRRPDGSRWRVAVEAPQSGKVGAVIELQDAAVATSGDYRKFWTDPQGRRRSHVLDPRTGEPISHALASATVVDRDGAWADALATGLLVLGPEEGRVVAARAGLAARLVLRQPDGAYAEWSTPAFEALVVPAR
jgi:FAD:protein FMN transferase